MKNNHLRFRLTFEWHSLLRDLCRNFWLIILAALIAYMGIYISERSVYSPTYTSSTTLVIRAKTGTSGTYTNLSVSADMTEIYGTVFKDASMKKMAAENIGMESFEGTVSTSVISGINLMSISVTADDPELAYNLLTSILEVYPNISESVFSDAVIDVLISPQMPTAPSNSISSVYRGIVILAAMILMGMAIAVLSLLRDTVKHEKAFDASIDAKLLGTVVHEKPHLSFKERLMGKKRSLLIDDAFSTLKFSEDYQKIANKLEHMQKRQGCKSFAVTSVAENEGKSTAAANIALALAGRGLRVALIDLDIRKPSIYKIFNFRRPGYAEFSDVLSQKTQEYQFLRYKRSSLLIAINRRCHSDAAQWLGSETTRHYLDSIRSNLDFVIIDTPPAAVSADAASLISICDRTVLVVRTDTVAVTDINDTIMTISNIGGNLAGCILNDVYRPFTLFGQMGLDESGSYSNQYGYYKRYGGYGNHSYSGFRLDADDFAHTE